VPPVEGCGGRRRVKTLATGLYIYANKEPVDSTFSLCHHPLVPSLPEILGIFAVVFLYPEAH
jgi:hypothetical protein